MHGCRAQKASPSATTQEHPDASLRIAQSFAKCRLFDMPNMLEQPLAHMDTFIVGLLPGKKFTQRVMKINVSTKSLVERLCDFKIYAISVLSFIGSVCAPDNATLKAEDHALQCTTARPYNAIPSSLLLVSSICGLGPDLIGIHSISLAARYRVAACSSTLRRGLEKVTEARVLNCTSLFALHTANAFDIICRLDRDDTLDEVSQNNKQKVATGLLLDKLRTQDFTGPLSSRASRPWSNQSSSYCGHSATYEESLACFPSWIACWLLSHPL